MIGRVAGVWTLRPGGDPGDPCAHVHAACDAWFHAHVAFHPAGVGQDQGPEVGGQHSATRHAHILAGSSAHTWPSRSLGRWRRLPHSGSVSPADPCLSPCTLRSRSDCEFQTLHLLSWVPSPERLVPGEAFLGSEHLCCFRWLLLWAVASLGPGVFAAGPLSSRAWCQLPEASAGGGRCFVPGRSLSWLNSPNPLRGLRNSMQVGPLIMRLRT